jgi:hypothetical protein
MLPCQKQQCTQKDCISSCPYKKLSQSEIDKLIKMGVSKK